MIKLNLLPPETRKKKTPSPFGQIPGISKVSFQWLSKIPLRSAYLYGVGGLLAFSTLLFLGAWWSRYTLGTLEKKLTEVAPDRAKIEQIAREYGELELAEKTIQSLDRPFSWSNKLKALSDSMVWGIWLQELSLGERHQEGPSSGGTPLSQRTLILAGTAASSRGDEVALIGRFIRSLKENENFYRDFSQVELESTKRRTIASLEVMDFKINCAFREGVLE